MIVDITNENFDEIIKSELPVMVDFGAEWCGPCKALAPSVEEMAAEFDGRAVICRADVEECDDVTMRFRIRNVPTVMFFKGGELKDKAVGSVQKSTLVEKLNALL